MNLPSSGVALASTPFLGAHMHFTGVPAIIKRYALRIIHIFEHLPLLLSHMFLRSCDVNTLVYLYNTFLLRRLIKGAN